MPCVPVFQGYNNHYIRTTVNSKYFEFYNTELQVEGYVI